MSDKRIISCLAARTQARNPLQKGKSLTGHHAGMFHCVISAVSLERLSDQAFRLFVVLTSLADAAGRYCGSIDDLRSRNPRFASARAKEIERFLLELANESDGNGQVLPPLIRLSEQADLRGPLCVQIVTVSDVHYVPEKCTYVINSSNLIKSNQSPAKNTAGASEKPTASRRRNAGRPPVDGHVGDPPGFVAFWEAWPKHFRKERRAKCAQIWEREQCEPIAELVMAGLVGWKASNEWAKESGQFIPAPQVWLGNRRWERIPPPSVPPEPDNGFHRKAPDVSQFDSLMSNVVNRDVAAVVTVAADDSW